MTTDHSTSLDSTRGASSVAYPCQPNRIGCLACAGPLFREVVKRLRAQNLTFDQQTLHLSVVERLESFGSSQPGRVVGLTDIHVTRVAAIDVTARATDIRIVRGLRPLRFQAFAAHELGHVWLANQNILSLPSWCMEGFCELVAYRYTGTVDSMEARLERARISANPDPIYGDGFRRLSAYCDRVGFHNLCEALKTNRLSSL